MKKISLRQSNYLLETMKRKNLLILINPKGRYLGEVYRSGKNGQWYWRTKSVHNGKKTAGGCEPFPKAQNARLALMRHRIDLKSLKVIY